MMYYKVTLLKFNGNDDLETLEYKLGNLKIRYADQ